MPTPLVPVAQYLRKSTEHQQYSLTFQSSTLKSYAEKNNFAIVQTYSDSKSGLVLKRRKGLVNLLRDVVAGGQPYKAILVYDVSRWGRFLDADESAHYFFARGQEFRSTTAPRHSRTTAQCLVPS